MRRALALSLAALTLLFASAVPTLAFERRGGGPPFARPPGFRGQPPFPGPPAFRGHPPFARRPVLPAPRFHGGGGHFHGHGQGVVVVGPTFWWGPWWGPWWYGPPAPQVIVQPAPVFVQQPAAESFWYYCQSAGAYYPTAPSCPEAWIKVPPRSE